MPLTDVDRQLTALISTRGDQLLSQLAEHVAIPTGHNYTPGLDQYRDLLIERLSALGAIIEHLPGQPRPSWIEQPGAGSATPSSQVSIPPTVLATHQTDTSPSVLIVGHIDTVHDPLVRFANFRSIRGQASVPARGVWT